MISVVIPAFDAAATIGECLDALDHQTLPREQYEIIVVDDESRDGTACLAAARGATVLAISHAGPAAARNHGIAAARGEIILFTDADCAPAPDWIERTVAALQNGTAGVKGAYLTRQRGLLPRFVQAEFEDRYRRLARADRIDFVDTYAAGYRRDALTDIGGFDPTFPVPSAEDVDLSFRLARKGYRLEFAPDARVYHHHPVTLRSYARRKWRYGIYRVAVYRRFPGKVAGDSYTPRLMLLEIALAGLAVGSIIAAGADRRFLQLAAAATFAHVLASLPFAARAGRDDPRVGIVAPVLLFVRSLAQGCGIAVGLGRALVEAIQNRSHRPPRSAEEGI